MYFVKILGIRLALVDGAHQGVAPGFGVVLEFLKQLEVLDLRGVADVNARPGAGDDDGIADLDVVLVVIADVQMLIQKC